MEKSDKTPTLKIDMQNFAESVAKECRKFYAPSVRDTKKSDAAINVVCLRAIKFRQQHHFGVLGVIRVIKMIRKQLKKLDYNAAFVNELTLFLVQGLMRMKKV